MNRKISKLSFLILVVALITCTICACGKKKSTKVESRSAEEPHNAESRDNAVIEENKQFLKCIISEAIMDYEDKNKEEINYSVITGKWTYVNKNNSIKLYYEGDDAESLKEPLQKCFYDSFVRNVDSTYVTNSKVDDNKNAISFEIKIKQDEDDKEVATIENIKFINLAENK